MRAETLISVGIWFCLACLFVQINLFYSREFTSPNPVS